MMMQAAPLAENQQTSDQETLSAFLDGELSEHQARVMLQRLSASPETRARLTEYWAVGDALRGLSGQAPDLSQRVMAALEREPTVLAPMRRPRQRQAVLWLAAATVGAVAWGLWNAAPRDTAPDAALLAAAPSAQPANVTPYLAAHQDFAQAVVATQEMHFTRINLAEAGR